MVPHSQVLEYLQCYLLCCVFTHINRDHPTAIEVGVEVVLEQENHHQCHLYLSVGKVTYAGVHHNRPFKEATEDHLISNVH